MNVQEVIEKFSKDVDKYETIDGLNVGIVYKDAAVLFSIGILLDNMENEEMAEAIREISQLHYKVLMLTQVKE